jgi:beta-phosphoglucomutase-like phosphatase (HAD superfamily)
LYVTSTSAPESVAAVLRHAMGEETASRFALVLAGDCVKAKKPAPDIYLLAAGKLGVPPGQSVVEDSANGLQAAVAAGMKCVVTVSSYTKEEGFTGAAIVVSCLGDPGREVCEVLANHSAARPAGYLTVADLESILAG